LVNEPSLDDLMRADIEEQRAARAKIEEDRR
jgi:hypothetical protein